MAELTRAGKAVGVVRPVQRKHPQHQPTSEPSTITADVSNCHSNVNNSSVQSPASRDIHTQKADVAATQLLQHLSKSGAGLCITISSKLLMSPKNIQPCRICNKTEPNNVDRLLSLCSYFYEDYSASESRQLLVGKAAGTFLLRKSSNPQYPYAMSVQTPRGATSVRIARTASGFVHLDCDAHQQSVMPLFRDVFELVHHYRHNSDCVFLEKSGRADTPIILRNSVDVVINRKPEKLAHLSQRVLNFVRLEPSGASKSPNRTVCVNCFVSNLTKDSSLRDKLNSGQWLV